MVPTSRMQQRYQRSPGNTVSGPAALAGGGSMAHSFLPCASARQTRYVAQPSAVLQHGEYEQSPPALTTQPAGAGAGPAGSMKSMKFYVMHRNFMKSMEIP